MALPLSRKKALMEWRLYLFVAPTLLLLAVFCYYPAVSAVYHSFFDWEGGNSEQFIGLGNFHHLLADGVLWRSFWVVFVLIVSNVVKLVPSIALAVAIHRLLSDKWQYRYRVLLVIPMIVPGLVTLFIWKFFFDPNFGALNKLLDLTGAKIALVHLDALVLHWGVFREGIPIPWLSEPRLIVPSLILWGFPWLGTVGVLLFLAGLQSIGTEVYEAADLDGVTSWQKFVHIEFPLILTQVRLNLVLLIIGTLQGYGLQLLLLGQDGGAGGRGMVPGLWMYNRAFIAGEFGYACSIGLVLFVFILGLTLFNNRFVRTEK